MDPSPPPPPEPYANPANPSPSAPRPRAPPPHDSVSLLLPARPARNTTANPNANLTNKFRVLGSLATDDVDALVERFSNVAGKSAGEVESMYGFELCVTEGYE